MKTSQRRAAREKAQHKWTASPVEELGPDYEDEFDLDHHYARELLAHEHEQRAQQQGQQR